MTDVNTSPDGSFSGAEAPSIPTDKPTPARIYDYLLGGKDNFAVDREVAEAVLEREPNGRLLAVENRNFLHRAVRYLAAEVGIRQFIDLGSGLPSQNNVHEVAQRHIPDARVIYVDNDPIVLAHGRAILTDNPGTTVITADLRDPARVLEHPETQALIDFDRPWALLCVSVLHFIAEDPNEVIGAYSKWMPSGSQLALSHGSHEATTPEIVDHITRVYQTTARLVLRSREQISGLFDGFDLAEPGLPLVMDWRPDEPPTEPERVWLYAGVGRKR